jgi:hypothetical protein
MNPPEPRNPFYTLLLLASLLFLITALAWAIVPTLAEKARAAGRPLPQSELLDLLNDNAGTWLLYEVAAMIVFGLLSMGLDRLRRLQKERSEATIAPSEKQLSEKGSDPLNSKGSDPFSESC